MRVQRIYVTCANHRNRLLDHKNCKVVNFILLAVSFQVVEALHVCNMFLRKFKTIRMMGLHWILKYFWQMEFMWKPIMLSHSSYF